MNRSGTAEGEGLAWIDQGPVAAGICSGALKLDAIPRRLFATSALKGPLLKYEVAR